MRITEWFKTKRHLKRENKALMEMLSAVSRKYADHLADLEVRLEKRNKQFRTVQNLLVDAVDIPFSALWQDLAKIKQELGILKATENRAEAELDLLITCPRVMDYIAREQKIPYQELERLQGALEQLATANQELQQWSGEGEERHVKP